MSSWQGKLFNKILHTVSQYSRPSPSFDVIKRRQAMERMTGFIPCPKGIINRKFMINNIASEWFYTPSHHEKVVLYFHGGAFILGSTTTHQSMLSQIALQSQCKILAINYRLAPEYPFPAGLEDGISAYNWLLEQGFKAQEIIIAGDSSGGNLALSTVLLLREKNLPLPAGIACLSPWVDLTFSGESIEKNGKSDPLLSRRIGKVAVSYYLQETSSQLPLVSPLFADLSHLPPLYIQVSDAEALYSDATRLAKQASIYGVDVQLQVYKGMIHSWQFAFHVLPEAKQALSDLGQFIRKV